MPTNQPTHVILSDEALERIEKRLELRANHMIPRSQLPVTPEEDVAALCATVRAAWAERDKFKRSAADQRLQNRHLWEANRTIVATNTALREQLAEARTENERLASQLKQWQEEKDTKAGYL